METLIALVVFLGILAAFILLLRAARSENKEDSIKNDIKAAVDVTARSLGKAAATVQNTATDARKAYSEHRDTPSEAPYKAAERVEKYEAIARLKALLDAGAISQDDFEAEKRKLLDRP